MPLHRRLLDWFDAHARPLPWRRTRDPWRILVSEVMLQQTRVEAVIPYYERFLARFPDAAALAAAPEALLLEHWAGLGYYRRAKNLQAAARAVAEIHGGAFPRTAAGLKTLPGIGRYTAGAVASIAFGAAAPLVDGNVARVLARLHRLETDVSRGPGLAKVWELAGGLLHPSRPGDWNQALMELGATVCLPRAPRCGVCPLAADCRAKAQGAVESCPAPRPRPAPIDVRLAVCVLQDGGRFAFVRRAAGERMAGLLDLPAVELPPGADDVAARERLESRLRSLGLTADLERSTARARHAITRHRVVLEVWTGVLRRRISATPGSPAAEAPADLAPLRIAARADAPPSWLARRDARALSALARKALDAIAAVEAATATAAVAPPGRARAPRAAVSGAPVPRASARRRSPPRNPSRRP